MRGNYGSPTLEGTSTYFAILVFTYIQIKNSHIKLCELLHKVQRLEVTVDDFRLKILEDAAALRALWSVRSTNKEWANRALRFLADHGTPYGFDSKAIGEQIAAILDHIHDNKEFYDQKLEFWRHPSKYEIIVTERKVEED